MITFSIILIALGIFIVLSSISSSAKEKSDIQNHNVLCKNCTHYFSNPDGYEPYCDCPKNTRRYRNPRTGHTTLILDIEKTDFRYNKNNDCKYYKRKWYKF